MTSHSSVIPFVWYHCDNSQLLIFLSLLCGSTDPEKQKPRRERKWDIFRQTWEDNRHSHTHTHTHPTGTERRDTTLCLQPFVFLVNVLCKSHPHPFIHDVIVVVIRVAGVPQSIAVPVFLPRVRNHGAVILQSPWQGQISSIDVRELPANQIHCASSPSGSGKWHSACRVTCDLASRPGPSRPRTQSRRQQNPQRTHT